MDNPSRRFELVPIDDLVDDPRNPKGHDDDALDRSIDVLGYIEPIVEDERTGRLISGHGRKGALIRRRESGMPPPDGIEVVDGVWHAWVVRGWASSDDDHAAAALVALNNIGARGGWVPDKVSTLLDDLGDRPDLLDLMAWDKDELSTLLTPPKPQPATPAPPAPRLTPPDTPLSQPGDLWEIGPHRLLVGDCRNPDDVARLLDDAKINVAFTSPPYAEQRDYDPASGFRPIPPDEYVAWFEPVAANVAAHLAADGSWFVNIKPAAEKLDTHLYVFDLVLAHAREWGWHFATEFCWERKGMPGRFVRRFKNQFEPIYQFARGEWQFHADEVMVPSTGAIGDGAHVDAAAEQGTPGHAWFTDRYVDGMAYPGNRLPTFDGSHDAVGHGAAFPVGLPAWFARAFSTMGDTLYDPFTGSGSTLLAAHDTGRIGYGIELSPAYVDVAVARIQRATGLVPKRAGDSVDVLAHVLADPAATRTDPTEHQ